MALSLTLIALLTGRTAQARDELVVDEVLAAQHGLRVGCRRSRAKNGSTPALTLCLLL
ncbi:hypothetical protein [Nonomuraea basaltis]|uniref:hypothetical protein n=1 Tax=Nonomuraea basaltis TaxID=2495887 RepID=UPI001485F9F7|nr:hypothetical protein [Nonomuraea basaltis]